MQAEKINQAGIPQSEASGKAKQSFAYPTSHRGPNYTLFSIVLDILATVAVILSVDLLLQSTGIIANSYLNVTLFASAIIVWPVAFSIMEIYQTDRTYPIVEETRKLILAVSLAILVMMGVLYLSYITVPRSFIASMFVMDILFLVGWRVTVKISERTRKSAKTQRVLIIGANELGKQISQVIHNTSWSNLEIFGYLDDTKKTSYGDLPIVGNLKDVRQHVEINGIDEVVVALPQNQFEDLNRIVVDLQSVPVQIRVIPSYLSLALYRATIDDLGGLPLINLRGPALTTYQRIFKRAFDLIAASLIMLAILPVMIVVAIAIRLDSQGPVFFRQLRVGENGRMFKMFKFRSMVVNAEALQAKINQIDDNGNIIHKTRNDPRVTKVGRILRKTSLDELPQFINVIKGEMSLVGPRPELPWLVEKYEPWQRQRFTVPQGITGWWQINGRSDKPCHLNTDQDLYYIENYSFLLDLFILIKTVPALLRGKGAF